MSTKPLVPIYLWCISLLLVFACSVSKPIVNQQPKVISLENGKLTRFKTTISFEKGQLTGILAVKQHSDTLTAVFLNEFGIKGFTFHIINNKCKIDNMLGPMDKWYIRKTLASDFKFIFNATKDLTCQTDSSHEVLYLIKQKAKVIGSLSIAGDSLFVMQNEKRHLNYSLQKLK